MEEIVNLSVNSMSVYTMQIVAYAVFSMIYYVTMLSCGLSHVVLLCGQVAMLAKGALVKART